MWNQCNLKIKCTFDSQVGSMTDINHLSFTKASHTILRMAFTYPAYVLLWLYVVLAPSQWETSLQSNTVSHWLGANLESALYSIRSNKACVLKIPKSKYHFLANVHLQCTSLLAWKGLWKSSGKMPSWFFLLTLLADNEHKSTWQWVNNWTAIAIKWNFV